VYQKVVCRERAGATYVLQPSGYTALAGDATLANGLVAKLQITEGQVFRDNFASEADALLRLNIVGGGTLYDNSDLPMQRTRKIGVSGTPVGEVASISEIQVNNDIVNAKDALAGEFITSYIDHQFNGGNGARSGMRVSLVQNGATTNKADLGFPPPFMKAITGTCAATAPDGGTAGDEYGNIHGGLLRAQLTSGATDYNAIVGLELNPNINTGASALRRTGFKIVTEEFAPVQGSALDNAFGIVNQALGAKWDYGFTLGDPTGVWPIDSTGTIMYAFSSGADPKTAANGINFEEVTFSGDAFKSVGFGVGGDGTARAEGLVFGESTTPATTNTMDRYEEGTWTPVLAFGGASVGVTYSLQEGDYTVMGDLVFVRAAVTLTSKGSSTGVLTLSLMAGNNPVKITPLATSLAFSMVAVPVGDLVPVVNPNGTITIKKGGGVSSQDVTDADVADTLSVVISGTYKRAT